MRQWAILVGLSNYQMFQPLNCAQQDAQALHHYLIHEAGFPPEQCLLLTDSSPPISGRPTTPTRANLQSWIELLTQQCFKPGDTLWFFFSGYGVCSQGRDYLVPLDGEPFAVETTCILMSDIFSRLQASLSPGLSLVLLDVNRSQSNYSNENVGMQTARLAKQLAVPTVLSCQPGQYSREISGLGQGLFTIALLEALKYHQAATPETLMRFLGDRIPELGAYYYLPNQQPLSLCPPEQLHQPLLQAQFANHWNGDGNGNGSYSAISANQPPSQVAEREMIGRSAAAIADSIATPPVATPQPPIPQPPISQPSTVLSNPVPDSLRGMTQVYPAVSPTSVHANPPQAYPAPPSTIPSAVPPAHQTVAVQPEVVPAASSESPPESGSAASLWRPILLWGGLLSLGLIACVLWRNWAVIQAPTQSPTPAATNTASPPTQAPATAQPSTNANPGTTSDISTPEVGASAQAPEQALDFEPGKATTAISGQAVLQNARRRVMSDQATPYRDAIDEAKQIRTNDPAYIEAQQDIAAWSQRIFDIAQQRATQKQWDIAIMAADLVPEDDRKLHPQAQALIVESCPAIQNQPASSFPLQRAKAICNQKPI